MTTNNMYRVGDFVYFESSVSIPYQIRKIEELNKTPQGAVEAKVTCYFRRRDISKNLIQQAEKHRFLEDDEYFDEDSNTSSPKLHNPKNHELISDTEGYFKDSHLLNTVQSHQAKHRELFLSRQMETLPATHIRGKCNVTLYNDAEPIFDYLSKEDTFFYKFTYDPSPKTLHAERNAIRVGSDYQTHIKSYVKEEYVQNRVMDELVYCPTEEDDSFNKFILLTRSLGILGRASDPESISQHPELLFSVSSTSRDITLQRSHDYWFKSQKHIDNALKLMLPNGEIKIFKDELEQWTKNENNLFQQGMEEYGKNFHMIRTKLMPWKSIKGIVEFYYMWKSTDKYWLAKRLKISSSIDHKLKQVYIPSFLKPNPSVLCTKPVDSNTNGCESCLGTKSAQWYIWGSTRICSNCWFYWKRYGGLKNPASRDYSLEQPADSNITLTNGDNTENPNQVGSFKCSQPNCDKEFRVKSQLFRHLHNNHGITQHNITNGSYDILNHYSKTINNQTNINHLLSLPGGRGMVKPRSTVVFKVNFQFRCGRLLLSDSIKPKRIAKNHNYLNSIDLDNIVKKIEKIPVRNLSNDCLKKMFSFTEKSNCLDDVIDNMWKMKNVDINNYLHKCQELVITKPKTTNGVHEKGVNKRPLPVNGTPDESEPLIKISRKMNDICNNNESFHDVDHSQSEDSVQSIK